jgi:pyruvate formate lyase activating enzyme
MKNIRETPQSCTIYSERESILSKDTGTNYTGKEKGLVFHIIHGSFVDGYGIRTTIFLKGCPLRCLWCCNPEGQTGHPELKYTASNCNGCGKCIDVCPEGAIQINPLLEKAQIDRKLCDNCGKCIDVCYTGALQYFGTYYTVDELFEIIRKDEQYYRSSGGGATIGGGEPTFQASFTYALMKQCQENFIHVAIDTCGYTTTQEQFKILAEADLLLYDIKGLDPIAHKYNTGVSNEIILSNLKKLNDMGKSIIIRIPIVPKLSIGKNVEDIAAMLIKLKSIERVDLLPYHTYGTIKYEQLDREYTISTRLDAQALAENTKKTLERYGLNVQLGG